MPLAAGYATTRSYPPFDPLCRSSPKDSAAAAVPATTLTAAQIYGAKVESEMSLKTVDFPLRPPLSMNDAT